MLKYSEIIDLTLPVYTGMSIPPANRENSPRVLVENRVNVGERGIHASYYQQGIHAGTHLDSPLHVVKGGATIDEMPLSHFMGPGCCIDCTEVKPNEPVTAAMLEKGAKVAGFDFFQDLGAKSNELHPEDFVVHRILLENGCLNIEHMTNLGKVVNTRFDLIALR